MAPKGAFGGAFYSHFLQDFGYTVSLKGTLLSFLKSHRDTDWKAVAFKATLAYSPGVSRWKARGMVVVLSHVEGLALL